MTIEEALKRNFTCTKIPGNPSIPPETCLARQEAAKEIRNKWRYPHCVDCDQGREIKIRLEKGESMGSPGRITCWCCERENQSFKKKIEDHRVCGFCYGHLSRALGAGVPIEEAKEEIKTAAQKLKPGYWPSEYSWSWNKKPEETKPAIMPCMNSECGDFKPTEENNCRSLTDATSCVSYSTTPPVKPTEEKHQENVAIKHVDIPADVKLTDPKIIESIPVPAEMKNPEGVITIDLRSEPKILEMLAESAAKNRRETLNNEILAILDEKVVLWKNQKILAEAMQRIEKAKEGEAA